MSRSRTEEMRRLIAEAGMSQRQAAEALEKTQRTVEYWLSGQQEPPLIAILAMRWIVSQR